MRINRAITKACALCAVVAFMGGCGADDVQLEGRVFDALGVSDSTRSRDKDVKLAARPPLVVPPTLQRLPDPNAPDPEETETASIGGIQDHDAKRQQSKSDLERKQAEYCKIHYELPKAAGSSDADLAEGPLGPCRASVLTSLKKWQSGEE